MAEEKGLLDRASDFYYGKSDSYKPKEPVKDPIDMQVGKDQFESAVERRKKKQASNQ